MVYVQQRLYFTSFSSHWIGSKLFIDKYLFACKYKLTNCYIVVLRKFFFFVRIDFLRFFRIVLLLGYVIEIEILFRIEKKSSF